MLNATATFRAPRAARGRLYEAPFLFNVSAPLLCACTRLLTLTLALTLALALP